MTYKSPKYREPKNPVGNVAELFAGVGGFRIGLAEAGWKTTFSNQYEPATPSKQHASDVYIANFAKYDLAGAHVNKNIEDVNALPKNIDLLVGGFPCQDYSVAKTSNSALGLEGKKGVLWWEILRLIKNMDKKKRPRFVFLENVDRLLKSPSKQRGRDFAIMLKTLGEAGYLIEWRAVNAAEYGFAQRRIRVFIVARLIEKLPKGFQFDAVKQIYKDGILARSLPIEQSLEEPKPVHLSESADLISETFNSGGGKSLFENTGVYYRNTAYTVRTKAVKAKRPATLGDVILEDNDVPKEYWISKDRLPEWEYLKGAKSIERVHKASGTAYNYAEGKMAYPDLLTNPSRTILTGEGGTSPSRFKHIIKTKKGFRRLTPVELERLNGFPDDWTKFDSNGKQVSDVRRAFFMGNALVIGLIERVGHVLALEARDLPR